ncbi:MAG: sigma-70 family RNA polymerase sigma factor [Bacteroidia bacterium]|nr:sigma-70 family RNA polymerase sigma factor [Bacteroidia bacterium]
MENQQLLIPHLFRTEYRKIISVLCKLFGFEHIEIAEDIVSDTFLSASETWGLKGIPQNPTAWLYSVAKNKALNNLHRKKVYDDKVTSELKSSSSEFTLTEIDLSNRNIIDSQLQMMFAICNPVIPPEAQIGLSLRILCGFGINEIADAFLTNKETINKRLFRAKEKLREEKIKIEMPRHSEISLRLETVLSTLYLLFSEGYYSTHQNSVIRKDLCLEAIRLTYLLIENVATDKPVVNALLSLMCFHASRFDARTNELGEIILYNEQNTDLWNKELITKGAYFLNQSAKGNILTRYHLEAAIGYWHTHKDDTAEKWENILQLYNQLLQIEYSQIAALNRTYALYKANGVEVAIMEALKLNLNTNHFYYTLLGELHINIDCHIANQYFERALLLAKSETDKNVIKKKISALNVTTKIKKEV